MPDCGIRIASPHPIAGRSPRSRSSRLIIAIPCLVLSLSAPMARAQLGAHTRADAFAAAVGSGVVTLDFEAISAGARLSGSTLSAPGASSSIVLPGALRDVLDPTGSRLDLVAVEDAVDNPASSGRRALGVVDPGNFDAIVAGEPLSFRFTTPTTAFGLTLITPEEPGAALFDGDLELRVAGEPTARLSVADGRVLGRFGGRDYRAYFLGVVGRAAFSTATLQRGAAVDPSTFLFNLDDLVVPLPEPRTAWLPAPALAWLAVVARSRHRRRRAVECKEIP